MGEGGWYNDAKGLISRDITKMVICKVSYVEYMNKIVIALCGKVLKTMKIIYTISNAIMYHCHISNAFNYCFKVFA